MGPVGTDDEDDDDDGGMRLHGMLPKPNEEWKKVNQTGTKPLD